MAEDHNFGGNELSAAGDRPPRIGGLDGLRGLSIAVVLLSHASYTANNPQWLRLFQHMGVVGVEIFFVISGFLITHLLLRERERTGKISLWRFWRRRALRIVPPLLAYCAGVAIAAKFNMVTWNWTGFYCAITFTKNIFAITGIEWFFSHIWSLSTEEQFYLIWPALLIFLINPKRARFWLSAAVLAGVVVTPVIFRHALRLSRLLPYWPYLAAGCWLAFARHDKDFKPVRAYFELPFRTAIFVAILGSAFVVSYWRHEEHWLSVTIPLDALLMPIAISLLLLEAMCDGRVASKACAFPPLAWLGRISYSVYLWQQLFLAPLPAYHKPWLFAYWPWNLIAGIASGYLSYVLIERSMFQLRSRLDENNLYCVL
jgi:peptidoglycan/LPS O-acetylase OafA/YrhL